jgi:TonB family protein
MPRAQILGLAVFLCAAVTVPRPTFAQIQPQPDLHPELHARDESAPLDQNRLVGFDAIAHELAAKLVERGQKKVIFMDFRGPDKYWSPFADWLADQFSLAFKTAGDPVQVIDRAKLVDYEPIEENESGTGISKMRVAFELGADTIVEGTYRPAENGVGVSLNAHPVIDPGDAGSVWTSPIITVGGKIPFTKEIGSKVYLPLDALWPMNKKFTPREQGVSAPTCVYCPNPQYSAEAHKKKQEGTVVLAAVVTSEGRATQIKVISSLGFGLDEEAIEAVKTWKFNPAADADGRPVPVYTPIEVTFRLN